MNLIVHQSIVIHSLKVNNVSNSAILQIGTAGIIKSLSNSYNSAAGASPPSPSNHAKTEPVKGAECRVTTSEQLDSRIVCPSELAD
jgi:spore germination protein PB